MTEEKARNEESKPTTSKELTAKNKQEVRKDEEDGDANKDRNSDDGNSYSCSWDSRESQQNMATYGDNARSAGMRPQAGRPRRRSPQTRRYGGGRVQKKGRAQTRNPKRRKAYTSARLPKEVAIYENFPRSKEGLQSACRYCGHRCCLRRYIVEMKKWADQKFCSKCRKILNVMAKPILVPKRRRRSRKKKREEAIQVSTARFRRISNLLEKSAGGLAKTPNLTDEDNYCEITPEMLKDSLEILTKWRQGVEIEVIMSHLKRNYPVNPMNIELFHELESKLNVGKTVGFIEYNENGQWMLSSAQQKFRRISKTHVSLFWKLYRDTLTPMKVEQKPNLPTLDEEQGDENPPVKREFSFMYLSRYLYK